MDEIKEDVIKLINAINDPEVLQQIMAFLIGFTEDD